MLLSVQDVALLADAGCRTEVSENGSGSGIVYYRWLNSPSFPVGGREARAKLYGRPARVVARGSMNSVKLEFLDGLDPRVTVCSRRAIQNTPPAPLPLTLDLDASTSEPSSSVPGLDEAAQRHAV